MARWQDGKPEAAISSGLLVAGFIGIPRKIMALKNLKAIIIDLNYIKEILFFLDLTGE